MIFLCFPLFFAIVLQCFSFLGARWPRSPVQLQLERCGAPTLAAHLPREARGGAKKTHLTCGWQVEVFVEATHLERLSRGGEEKAVKGDLDAFRRFWSDQRDEWQARQQLVAACAPWLSGLPVPKLGLLLTLVGGSPQERGEEKAVEALGLFGRRLSSC